MGEWVGEWAPCAIPACIAWQYTPQAQSLPAALHGRSLLTLPLAHAVPAVLCRAAYRTIMLSYAGWCSLWIPLLAWMMPSHSFRVGMVYLKRSDWTFEVRLRSGAGGAIGTAAAAVAAAVGAAEAAVAAMHCQHVGVCRQVTLCLVAAWHGLAWYGAGLLCRCLQQRWIRCASTDHCLPLPLPPSTCAEFARLYRRTTSLQDFVAASSTQRANGNARAAAALAAASTGLDAGAARPAPRHGFLSDQAVGIPSSPGWVGGGGGGCGAVGGWVQWMGLLGMQL